MNRRGFLGSLAALAVAPFLPKFAPKPAPIALDLQTGIAIRFIQKWDVASAARVSRYDAFVLGEPLGVRILDA